MLPAITSTATASFTFRTISTTPDEWPCRVRVLDLLLDVLHGDEAAQDAVGVHHRQLLDLVAVEDLLRLRERRPDRRGDEVARGHERRDGLLDVALEAEVAVREDPDEHARGIGDRNAGDLVVRHQLEGLADERVGRQRDRLDDHARLRPLHLVDLGHLGLDREVAVEDADAAEPCEPDREARLRHRVHRRRGDRDRQLDRPRQPRARRHVARQDVRLRRDEQHVVEGESLVPELAVELKQPLDVVGVQLGCCWVPQGAASVSAPPDAASLTTP
jgi:hypothetical protein